MPLPSRSCRAGRFHRSLPERFRATAFRYLDGDDATLAQRPFDYGHLVKTLGGSWT
ncbi:MAG: hypothetical protein P8Y58_00810 [Novosphingobium sp.]